jgi:O-glycosyl hydrolase
MKKWFAVLPVFLMIIQCVAQVDVTLDDTKQHQTIEGFGGFGPAKPWWEGAPHYDADYLRETIDNLGVTFFRTQVYWDGEITNDNDDPTVANTSKFNFGPSSDNGKQFPFLKDLSERGAKLIATVWTPPTWMKLFDDEKRKPTECYNCNQCPVEAPVLRCVAAG